MKTLRKAFFPHAILKFCYVNTYNKDDKTIKTTKKLLFNCTSSFAKSMMNEKEANIKNK